MAVSPMRVPIVIMSSRVKKTPNGMFCIGKSEFLSTCSHDFLSGLLAEKGIINYFIKRINFYSNLHNFLIILIKMRSEERRVGKESRTRESRGHQTRDINKEGLAHVSDAAG